MYTYKIHIFLIDTHYIIIEYDKLYIYIYIYIYSTKQFPNVHHYSYHFLDFH